MARTTHLKASHRNDVRCVIACLVGVVVWGIARQANAQVVEPAGPSIAWNLAVGSDYVFRGVSQTEEGAAVAGGVDLTSGTFYAGAWASNVAFPGDRDTSAEFDVYAGIRPEFAGWNWDIGAVVYAYVDEPEGADYTYVEAKVAVSRAFGPITMGASVYYSPDYFGAPEDEATYAEINGALSPADRWTLSGAVGRQFVSSDFDYTTWNFGIARQLTDNLTLDVRYHDTGEHDFGHTYGSRAVASLKATF